MPHIHEPVSLADQMKERMAEDARLKELHEDIGRLTFEIGCMKTELDAERKTKADDIKMFGDWLEGMIEMEVTHPMGPDNTHVLKGCLEYFNKLVAK